MSTTELQRPTNSDKSAEKEKPAEKPLFEGFKPETKSGVVVDKSIQMAANEATVARAGLAPADELLRDKAQTAQTPATDKTDQTSDKPGGQGDQPNRVMLDVFNYGASPGYAQEIANGIATLPENVAQQLKDKGIRVDVFKDIFAYDKAMGTHKADQKVNGHSAALDGASFFDSSAKPPHIAVFENLGDGTPVKSLTNTDAAGLGRHEAGHAYSFLQGYATMRDAKFQAAMGQDVDNLTHAQTQKLIKEVQPGGPMNYYLGSPNKEEFYAEAFATATGRGSDKKADARLRELFPNTLNYLRDSTQ